MVLLEIELILTKANCSKSRGVWQGVAIDSLKFHPGLTCPTLLCPVGMPVRQAACGRLLPPWDTLRHTPMGKRLSLHVSVCAIIAVSLYNERGV
jgi:hypothetical protein